ncbi:MAG: ABC transporter substrate-binding protein [Chloroflexota bacterium]
MRTRKLLLMVSWLTILGLLVISCAPAVAPTPKPEAPAPAKAPTTAPAAPAPTKAPAAPPAKPTAAPAKPAAPSPSPKPTVEQPRYGGILRVADKAETRDYDIHQAVSVRCQTPLSAVYNGLLQFDQVGDPGNIIGDLAERWEASPDGKVYTFYLHKNVKWHDGKPFSSEDVKFSIERQANPPKGTISPRKDSLTGIDKIETPDPSTVRIALQYRRAAFIPFVASAWCKILAKHVVEPLGNAKSLKAQVGTGPFKLKEHVSGVSFEVTKNADYFLKGRPYVDGILRYFIMDTATRFAAFRTHKVNMTGLITMGFTPTEAEFVERELAGKATVHRFPGMVFVGLSLNTKTPPFNDIRARKAVALALDRASASGMVLDEFKVGGFQSPGGKWALPEDELMKIPGYRQPKDADRAEAKKLLAEAGYADGLKVKLLDRIGGTTQAVRAEFLQDQLKKVGINMELAPMEDARYYSELGARRFTVGFFYMGVGIDDPDAGLVSIFHTKGALNYAQFSDEEVDQLLDEQSRELDEKKRRELVLKAQRRVMDLAPVVEIYWNWGVIGTWNEVRNWKPGNGIYERAMFQEVWLAQ